MPINGNETQFCGTVVVLLADTLAAHDIGGFKIGVGFALRKCRVCLATKETMQTKASYFFIVPCSIVVLVSGECLHSTKSR